MTPERRRRSPWLPLVLVMATLIVSIISSLGAPLIPTIAHDFHQPLASAQWSLTVGLLSGAVSAPVMGRLGDGRWRRATIIAGLVALLVAVAQGSTRGWTSPATLGLLAGAIAVLSLWALQQTHTSRPLVEIRLLRHPAVLAGNGCAAVMGIAMYMDLSAVSEFVQMPRSGGFGFSASTAVAGLILLPLAAFMLASSRMLPVLLRYLGSRLLLASGSLVVSVSSVFFALFHDSLWQAFVMMGILGIGLGTTFAVIPGLIVQAVPPAETGSALGFYQVVRYVGFSLGGALAASILGRRRRSPRPTRPGRLHDGILGGGRGLCRRRRYRLGAHRWCPCHRRESQGCSP